MKTLSKIIEKYAAFETQVRIYCDRICRNYCSACKGVCCKPEYCAETLTSPVKLENENQRLTFWALIRCFICRYMMQIRFACINIRYTRTEVDDEKHNAKILSFELKKQKARSEMEAEKEKSAEGIEKADKIKTQDAIE